jgi:primosomal protein N' (replication factor Y)
LSSQLDFLTSDLPSSDRLTLFADVILPLPLPKLYTYRVPYEMNDEVMVGTRVIVQFGVKKVLSCIVAAIHQNPPEGYQAKYLLEVIDEKPVVTTHQLRIFNWIAEYYMCTIGEVINAALPAALKLSSESRIQLHPHFNPEESEFDFTAHEENILYALQHTTAMTFTEVGNLLQIVNFHKIIKSLIQKQAIIIFEEIADKYTPKIVKKLKLSAHYIHEESLLEELLNQLASRPKQLDVIMHYLQQVPVHQNVHLNEKGIAKSVLTGSPFLSVSAINSLIKKEVLVPFDVIVSRFPVDDNARQVPMKLSEYQEGARDEILSLFAHKKDIVLLHGITGSGKTEVYIDLISKGLEAGGQVLYLLPEIALTAQIVTRLMKVFGNRLGVYHSKFSDNERAEVWNGILSGRFSVVVGVRSAIFLPFHNLSLIIIDEEHESSYKQYDPSPRYNAREVALMLATFHQAKTLLGSATPAVETYYNCKSGKWGLVTMNKRFGQASLPEIGLVDTRREGLKKTMHSHFSNDLLTEIEQRLRRQEQVILFQNRRGYAPYISCNDCAWIPKCKNCAVSLSYHKFSHELRCHYCGYHENMRPDCPACGSSMIRTVGFGTEKIEDELKLLLPEANIQRMDLDTTKSKNAYQQIIADFEKNLTNVLVGTQMVTKGLDFENVSLVGIINADSIINYPDYRAHERAYQMFVQVSGRAGRKSKKGKVIIQTANPGQPIFQKVIDNDYQALYEHEIQERRKYGFPPFVRVIRITVKHLEEHLSAEAASSLAREFRERLGAGCVLGPEVPYIFKIRNQFLNEIHIKLDRNHMSLKAAKIQIAEALALTYQRKEFKGVRLVADVDPM